MTTLCVTYFGEAKSHFDREYYISHHMPLVRRTWETYGLQTGVAYFPGGGGEGIVALCLCNFRDEAAMKAAISASETKAVMKDVSAFTDIHPVQTKTVQVVSGSPQLPRDQRDKETRLIVTCVGGTRFDRSYYVDQHLPTTLSAWKQFGLESTAAFFPSGKGDGIRSVGVYIFRNEQALHGALQSAEAAKVMDDVTHFTDAKVDQSLSVPL